jgi:hypothetical protein
VVDEEDAVDVVDLVLEDRCFEAFAFQFNAAAVAVQCADGDFL